MTQQTNVTKVIRVKNAVAAGTSNQSTTAVDTAGYQGCRFIAAFGTLTATAVTSVKVTQADDSGISVNAEDLAGSGISLTPSTDDNKVVIVDVYRPSRRYLQLTILRGTANAVIDGVVAELYEGRLSPIAKDTTVKGQVLLASPAAGTP